MSKNNYSIYQVKEGEKTQGICFEPLERLHAAGGQVDRANYDLIYAGAFGTGVERQTGMQILSELYTKFNVAYPLDYAGHSLSVSDVVVLRFDDLVSAHYMDDYGYAEVPEFLDGPYRYYSTQRPVDIGTFPKTEGGPERIENYDKRIPVEDGKFQAWGILDYSAPLTRQQMEGYELRAAFDNPYLYRIPPCQLEARLQAVGRWEQAGPIPKADRITEWKPDSGRFALKDSSQRWLVNLRFKRVVAEQERPSIARQLEKGAEQAAKNNAARPAPDKKTNREDFSNER